MTRFARSKGSKSSNERVPEKATSWTEMKEQLLLKNKEIEDDKKREEFMIQRTANYKAFLDEKAQENAKSQWSSFPNVKQFKQTNVSASKDEKKTKSADSYNDQNYDSDEAFHRLKNKVDKVLDEAECGNNGDDSDAPPDEESAKKVIVEPTIKSKKVKKKKLKILTDGPNEKKFNLHNSGNNNGESKHQKGSAKKRKNELQQYQCTDDEPSEDNKKIIKKKAFSSNDLKQQIVENLTEQDLKRIEKKKQRRIKQIEKKKIKRLESIENEKKGKPDQSTNEEKPSENKKIKIMKKKGKHPIDNNEKKVIKENLTEQDLKKLKRKSSQNGEAADQKVEQEVDHFSVASNSKNNNNWVGTNNSDNSGIPNRFGNVENKKPKIRDNNEHTRKKPLLPHKMFINGKELEIDYIDGFPVRKEDAVRLKKLRKEMISKGLPGSEIKISMKLERRKAEKAFAREKKKVCYNCRKSGHNLSECPEIGKDELAQTQGSGICFKCGSTEHTHFECKVVRGQEFKFAQCFVCNEQGHIARQCPDNARGLYPKAERKYNREASSDNIIKLPNQPWDWNEKKKRSKDSSQGTRTQQRSYKENSNTFNVKESKSTDMNGFEVHIVDSDTINISVPKTSCEKTNHYLPQQPEKQEPEHSNVYSEQQTDVTDDL
ncbi:hypothetical protein JTB14_003701 [Gonioctena quinquepunctata]|nr:hypothetical protein JTB14_003701 [Gonioctena quinquepunctata]